ncbi:hypothetical protein GCM10008955_40950 [Deinococcus malanensis]|uniref:Uncharacterized protein n=1 Tax=Deinococcus malanensis TaxID=1706855 RepID=A0ABQ2F236_9DEIO|nr:hypothetical protein [Deinococcus malanensis]GGK42947.1 hypothetical protein GCM10008955_40950 [Deinococcus malanensis]
MPCRVAPLNQDLALWSSPIAGTHGRECTLAFEDGELLIVPVRAVMELLTADGVGVYFQPRAGR